MTGPSRHAVFWMLAVFWAAVVVLVARTPDRRSWLHASNPCGWFGTVGSLP